MGHRALVVGAGERGRQWIDELSRNDGWHLVGVVEPDERILHGALGDRGLSRSLGYADIGAALERSGADVGVIASPAESHLTSAMAGIASGLHLLVEKPMTATLSDAETLVASAKEKGVAVVVGQNYRYMRSHRTARRLVGAGAIGRVLLVSGSYYRVPHEMAPSLAASGHAALWGMAVHHLDAFRHVLGLEAVEVAARISTCSPEFNPSGATLRALISFEGGVECTYVATYESSGHEYFEQGQEYYQRLVGDEGTLHMFHRWLFLCRKGAWPRFVRRGRRDRSEEAILLDELVAAMDGREVSCSARDNLGTMVILEACVRSSDEQRTVSVDELKRRVP